MDYLFAGLLGMAAGAALATVVFLVFLQRCADRDLIERRLRALIEYRDCLGNLPGALDGAGHDPAVVEQAWRNVGAFCREFRLTAWYLSDTDREALGPIVGELEREAGARRLNGAGSLARLVHHHGEIDRLLSRAVDREVGHHRGFRFLPMAGRRAAPETATSTGPSPESLSSSSDARGA